MFDRSLSYLNFLFACLGSLMAFSLLAVGAWALPAEVTTAFTTITGDFNDLMALAWPLIALVVSAFWVIKAFKRVVFSA